MKLADAKIKSGDLFAFKGQTWFSRLIRCFTTSRVTHVGIARWASDGVLEVIEALEGKGVRVFRLDRYLKDHENVDWYELIDFDSTPEGPEAGVETLSRGQVVQYCREKWGLRYAHPFQFVRSWGAITSRVADALGVPDDLDGERFFCSELVMSALRHAGYRGEGYDKDPAETPPADIVELTCFRRRGKLEL